MPHPPALPGAIDMQALTGLSTAELLPVSTLFMRLRAAGGVWGARYYRPADPCDVRCSIPFAAATNALQNWIDPHSVSGRPSFEMPNQKE